MKSMFENFINGNLKDAKSQATQYTFRAIFIAGQAYFSRQKAAAVASYLTNPNQYTWQRACDAN